jgi:hypothetical protein
MKDGPLISQNLFLRILPKNKNQEKLEKEECETFLHYFLK